MRILNSLKIGVFLLTLSTSLKLLVSKVDDKSLSSSLNQSVSKVDDKSLSSSFELALGAAGVGLEVLNMANAIAHSFSTDVSLSLELHNQLKAATDTPPTENMIENIKVLLINGDERNSCPGALLAQKNFVYCVRKLPDKTLSFQGYYGLAGVMYFTFGTFDMFIMWSLPNFGQSTLKGMFGGNQHLSVAVGGCEHSYTIPEEQYLDVKEKKIRKLCSDLKADPNLFVVMKTINGASWLRRATYDNKWVETTVKKGFSNGKDLVGDTLKFPVPRESGSPTYNLEIDLPRSCFQPVFKVVFRKN